MSIRANPEAHGKFALVIPARACSIFGRELMTFTLSTGIISTSKQLQFMVQIALGFRWGLFLLLRKPLVLLGFKVSKININPEKDPLAKEK